MSSLDYERARAITDGRRVIKRMRELLDATERCLAADHPGYPVYLVDLGESANALVQLAVVHATLSRVEPGRKRTARTKLRGVR